MQPPLPAPVATWRNDTYDAISPSRPELSQKGKTIVITGAGSGIGRETVLAFASAGAAHVALLGRSESALTETASTASSSYPQTKTSIHAVDIADEAAVAKVVADIGTWDVLIHGAGHVSEPSTIASASVTDYWKSFETNAKGTFVVLHSFANTANSEHATVLALTTGTTALPAATVPGLSAYMASKLAQTKLIEHFAAENAHIMAANVHPGMVETKVFTRSGAKAEQLPMDTVQLPAHFLVWMSSPEARFLKGRSAWSNWDVTELQDKAAGITKGLDLTSGINGWPFGV